MKYETIKGNIDIKILRDMETLSPSYVREQLRESSQRFAKNITEHPKEFTLDSIESISDKKSRYLCWYVFFAKQRVIDLYKVEIRDLNGWSCHKKFKALLFKEKLEGKKQKI